MTTRNKKITALFADYDGTLCPTTNLLSQDGTFIPASLERTLWTLSTHIPICIISSKDFHFLVNRAPFANAFSCILGIETLVIKRRNDMAPEIDKHKLLISRSGLRENAAKLEAIAYAASCKFPSIIVEKKITHDGFLASVTLDWRETADWEEPRKEVETYAQRLVANYNAGTSRHPLYLKTYSSHPFLDIYSVKCDKGTAFKYVLAKLEMKDKEEGQIMYLGHSENDNPAFSLADISIGIRSDPRLKPKLNCDFNLEYEKVASFLQGLIEDDLVLSDSGLKMLNLRNNGERTTDGPKHRREISSG